MGLCTIFMRSHSQVTNHSPASADNDFAPNCARSLSNLPNSSIFQCPTHCVTWNPVYHPPHAALAVRSVTLGVGMAGLLPPACVCVPMRLLGLSPRLLCDATTGETVWEPTLQCVCACVRAHVCTQAYMDMFACLCTWNN